MSGVPDHSARPVAVAPEAPLNALTVDVEEHFQVSAFETIVSRERWGSIPSRVEANTARLLDLFDEVGVRATFFVLGWLAERRPRLVRAIAERGHELGCHGYSHRLVYQQRRAAFRDETARARQAIEQSGGVPVVGYRAASFSIDRRCLWALEELVSLGFRFDSSLFPVHHDRYGVPGAPRDPYRIGTPAGVLLELPPSTVEIGPFVIPFAGGGYLRLYPMWFTHWGIRRLNRLERRGAVVYVHPWELDPEQPKVGAAPWLSRIRHYSRLHATADRLRSLIATHRFSTASDLLESTRHIPLREIA